MKKIGFVHSGSKTSFVRQFAAINTGLAVMGFKKEDYEILPSWADDNPQRLRGQIKDLVNNDSVDVVIAAGGPLPAIIARDETHHPSREKTDRLYDGRRSSRQRACRGQFDRNGRTDV